MRALVPEMAAAIATKLKAAGFTYVALDLDPEARAALGQRARESVPTVRAMQEATLDVYETVLHGG